jgi:hypothetical protein
MVLMGTLTGALNLVGEATADFLNELETKAFARESCFLLAGDFGGEERMLPEPSDLGFVFG